MTCSIGTHRKSSTIRGWTGCWQSIWKPGSRASQRPLIFGSSGIPSSPLSCATGKLLHDLRQDSTPTGFYQQSVSWSPDSRRLAWSGGDKTARIWDVAAEKQVLSLARGEPGWFNSVVWSPGGELLATASNGPEEVERAGDITINAHASTVFSVSWSPDSRQVASASYDQTIKVWDAATGQHVRTLTFDGPVYKAAWSRDGRWLALIDAKFMLRIVDATSGELVQTLQPQDGNPQGIEFSRDGRWLAAGGTVWEVATWTEVFRLVEPQSGDWQTWSPDSRRLAISGVNNRMWSRGGQQRDGGLTRHQSPPRW